MLGAFFFFCYVCVLLLIARISIVNLLLFFDSSVPLSLALSSIRIELDCFKIIFCMFAHTHTAFTWNLNFWSLIHFFYFILFPELALKYPHQATSTHTHKRFH